MNLDELTARIVASYREVGGINHVGGRSLPARAAIARVLQEIEELCFPGFSSEERLSDATLAPVTRTRVERLADALVEQVTLDLAFQRGNAADLVRDDAVALVGATLQGIPALRAALALDVKALLEGDPAARAEEEIILAYPGLRAVVAHRVAHGFWTAGARLVARMMSEDVHGRTGIDIHPGATIGRSFYIDHGTGVVIGETTVIGDHVKLYQGVSLGALSVSRRLQDQRRHPTIEDHVTIYAGATILGGDTVVGHHSVVGGNVWLVTSVPPYSVVEHEATVRVGSRRKDGGGDFDPGI